MRIEIKTNRAIKDKDIRAMYIIAFVFSLMNRRMIEPTLHYFADKFGYQLLKK